MNCPHGMPDAGAGDPPCAACVNDELERLEWKLRDVTASIARCDHRNRAAFGTGGSVVWCKDCGAIHARDVAQWSVTEAGRYAKEVDELARLWGRPHSRREDDSGLKNVIPMKPRT
jgi:hypothetical protein